MEIQVPTFAPSGAKFNRFRGAAMSGGIDVEARFPILRYQNSIILRYHPAVRLRHRRTLAAIFSHPTSGNIPWRNIEALFVELGAEIGEREGSRVGVRLFGDRRVFHRPHPGPETDKGAVASIRDWLRRNGVEP